MPPYTAFGLRLSASHHIPGLIDSPAGAAPDTHIHFHAEQMLAHVRSLPHRSCYVGRDTEEGPPALEAWSVAAGAFLRLRYADGTEFVVDDRAEHVWAAWPESSTLADTATYLLGPVMGYVLRRRGFLCLHASAVAMEGQAVAFAGPPFSGKSTIAAMLTTLGECAIADDVLVTWATGGRWYARPAYPQLRLWPESVALLFGREDALPPLTPTWEKRAMNVAGWQMSASHALPLAAIFVLDGSASETTVRSSALRGREAVVTLLGNTYVSYLLDAPGRAREFHTLNELARDVEIRRLAIPPGAQHAPQVRAHLRAHTERLRCTASPTTGR